MKKITSKLGINLLAGNVPGFGILSFSCLIVIIISGILLSISYDFANPKDSISFILIYNPYASILRGIHYWSSQLFLIITLIHILEYFKKKTEKDLNSGIWIRTALSLPSIFLVMFSGFFLRGDAESSQALRIFSSLIDSVPIVGSYLNASISGSHGLQLIYIHHIFTFTAFIYIASAEHSKSYFPPRFGYYYIIPACTILALLFVPGLVIYTSAQITGPWYFIGLQEALSFLPVNFVLILLGIIFFCFISLKYAPNIINSMIKRLFLLILFIYLLVSMLFFINNNKFNIGKYFQYSFVSFQSLFPDTEINSINEIPIILGKREACLKCHKGIKGFSPSHSPNAVGCSSCHLGNSLTLNKNLAHEGMVLIAGNLSTAEQTCGNKSCHPGLPERVKNSLMSNMFGIVSVDKKVMGEANSNDSLESIDLIGHSNAEMHLRNLCASCHISKEKEFPQPVDELTRGGGCAACHLNYSPESEKELEIFLKNNTMPRIHPSLSLEITPRHCFGCHSRSGRISTSYEGWHETLLTEKDILGNESGYRKLADGRIFEKQQEDIHHKLGMECIDCHNSYELMGDGKKYTHKEEQVTIRCEDCHFNGKPETVAKKNMDDESIKIVNLRKINSLLFLKNFKSGKPILNTFVNESGIACLKPRTSDTIYKLKAPSQECYRYKEHKSLSCKTCHTSWAPQCITCHTQFKPGEKGLDNLEEKESNGAWTEKQSDFIADEPSLGNVTVRGTKQEIGTFVPGMILTIKNEKSQFIFKRLYAPLFSHTIIKASRSCKSCHNSSLALGYGRGRLIYKVNGLEGKWYYYPKYKFDKEDNLPHDAWIGFLQTRGSESTTRNYTSPLTIGQQKKILLVGACLTCHSEKEKKISRTFSDFENYRKYISRKCILPVY